MKIDRFEDIEAWKLARKLTRQVYALTRKEEFQMVYALAGETRACTKGFIKYLQQYAAQNK